MPLLPRAGSHVNTLRTGVYTRKLGTVGTHYMLCNDNQVHECSFRVGDCLCSLCLDTYIDEKTVRRLSQHL